MTFWGVVPVAYPLRTTGEETGTIQNVNFFQTQAQGKAIPDHPALRGGVPVQILDMNSPKDRKRGPFSQSEANRHLQSYGGNDAVDWVMDCVRLYCDSITDAPWHLEKEEERLYEKKTDLTPKDATVGPKALYDLLKNPNPYMDYDELISLMVIDLLLVGNAYWMKWRQYDGGKPLALYRLAPPYVKVVPGEFGIDGFEYTVPGVGQRKPLELGLDEVVHFKLPNPHSPYYGLGVVQGGGRPLDYELALTDHQASYFEKGTNPSMIVQTDRRVSDSVFKKLQGQLRGKYGGPKNAGDLMVLEAGLKATTLTPNAADAMFEPLTKLSRDRVLAMFRVPPRMLGITDGTTGSDKTSDFQRTFDQKAIAPFLSRQSRKISTRVTQAWDVDFKVPYEYQMPPEEQIKLATNLAAIPGIKVKQVLNFLNLPPTGDEEIDDMVLNLPGEEGEEGDTRNGFPDRNLGGEGGRPPKGENTKPITKGALPRESRARRPSEKALRSIDDLLEDVKALEPRVTIGRKLPDEQRPPDTLARERADEINRVAKELEHELLDAVHVLERGLLDHVEGKAWRPNNFLQRMKNSDSWKTFHEMTERAMDKATKSLLSAASVQNSTLGVNPEDEIDYDALAKQLVHRREGVSGIVRNFRTALAKKVKDALAEGATAADAQALIQEHAGFWREHHAETVALTESVLGYNLGALEAQELSGRTETYVEDGDDHDEPCIEANGSVWPIEYAREHLLEHPRCRRAFLPL